MSRLTELCKELRIADLSYLSSEVKFKTTEQYLTELLELAVQQRHTNRIERLIRQAGFPIIETLENRTFERITFPTSIDQEGLLDMDFIERKENLCFLGSCGTGKTSLAIALGIKACMQGRSVRFYRTIDLANELVEKYDSGKARGLIEKIAKADVLVLDEIGYVPFNKKASEMLFSVISNSYQRQSILITSNLDFGRWTEIFGDDRLTAALIDRIVHHSHILAFTGPSIRLEQAMARRNYQPERKN
ncbi:MAG: IS21-like element helper ATPase IstB [Syntrophales bacterium]|nr:IS21-like element helper ATPase IstB [Syntrophales bacterium]